MGQRIVVTRPRSQAIDLVARLRGLGAHVLAAPAIRLAPPASWVRLDGAIRKLDAYDAVIFTSANAVERFFARASRVLRRKPAQPPRLFAIGPRTARALAARGWTGAAVPDRFEGEALARRIRTRRGWRVLLPRAHRAREALPRALRRRGAKVDVVEAYRTLAHRAGLERIRRAVAAGGVSYMTFTSDSTVEHVVHALGGPRRARQILGNTTAASIGPITSAALRRYGIRKRIEAKKFTSEGLVRTIISHARR